MALKAPAYPTAAVTAALVAALGCLAFAAPASAHHGCAGHAKGGKITHKTKESHVLEKKNRWYGCTTKTGRPRLLPGLDTITAREFGDGTVPTQITLSGVFVAYQRYTFHPAGGAGDTQTDLYVVDLRTGKVVIDEDATSTRPQLEDRQVNRIVLKRNGSVGWVSVRQTYGTYPDYTNTYEVHRHSLDPAAPGRATLDEGTDIDPQSLRLSSDRRTMTWTRGGVMKSAPLP